MTDNAEQRGELALALARMQASPQDDAARLCFYGVLADSELFLMLDSEPGPGQLRPRLFDLAEGRVALVFDSEARLAEFAGQTVDYAALPGRVLVAMMAGEGLAMMVNPDSEAPALLPPDALRWLADTLAAPSPAEASARAAGFGPPALDAAALARLRQALERRLSGVPGLTAAVLATARWESGGEGPVLALARVPEPARPKLARAVAEALVLSGLEEGVLDVIFPLETAMAPIAEVGLHLSPEPFEPATTEPAPRAAPGMDPARPPRLR
ncbi:MAG: SseB family protein [Pararhodobacter sp.]|nr:SseB family protein [Pararhodobacter sp.]